MFNFLGDGVDGLYKTLWLLTGLQLLFSGGVGFIFRLISRPFNMDFENKMLRETDRKILDLQLLRLFHGINVSTIEDAELAALAISRNKIKTQRIWLMLFCPPIGKSKHGKIELFLMAIIFIYSLSAAVDLAIEAKNYHQDEVLLRHSEGNVMVSELYVRDVRAGKSFNRSQCSTLPTDSRTLLKTACHYLTSEDPYLRKELAAAISRNNKNLLIALLSALFFLFLAGLTAYSYSAYREVNNQFYEFKVAERKYRARQRYKGIFKNKGG